MQIFTPIIISNSTFLFSGKIISLPVRGAGMGKGYYGQPRSELFRDDKLHLNDKGYVVWTEIIKKELNKIVALP